MSPLKARKTSHRLINKNRRSSCFMLSYARSQAVAAARASPPPNRTPPLAYGAFPPPAPKVPALDHLEPTPRPARRQKVIRCRLLRRRQFREGRVTSRRLER